MHGHMNVKKKSARTVTVRERAQCYLIPTLSVLFHTNKSGDTVNLRHCFPANALLLLLKINHRPRVYYNT